MDIGVNEVAGQVTQERPLNVAILGLWGMNIPGVSFGGFETAYSEIGRRLVAMGYGVTIYCRAPEYRSSRPASVGGVRLVYVPSSGRKSLSFLTATTASLAVSIVRDRPDVYLFANVGSGLHCLFARLLGQRVILNVDGLDWTRGKWGRFARSFFILAARAGMFASDVVLTDSEAMVAYYSERFAFEPEMIAYGAEIEQPDDESLIRTLGLDPGEYYLIASRLIPENNADHIIDEFRKVRTTKRLVIVGAANYDSPFHRKISESGDPRVLFTGWIDDQRLIKELHCGAYAYLHGHSVGGTNPALLKALGYSNCVLALNTPFNSEVLADGAFGLLWTKDPGDLASCIQKIEDSPDIAEEFRRRAPSRIREAYTWERITRQYDELLARVAGGYSISRSRIQVARVGTLTFLATVAGFSLWQLHRRQSSRP